MDPTIYKPGIYKGAGIYKAGAEGGGGGGDILLLSLCDNIIDNKDVPIIGGESADLTQFNYNNLNTGYSLNCNSIPASYSGTINIFDISDEQFNFECFLNCAFNRQSSHRTYGFKIGPFIIASFDEYSQPVSIASNIGIFINNISPGVNVSSNTSYERRSNGQLYALVDSYNTDKLYTFYVKVDDTKVYLKELSTGKYISFDKEYYIGKYALKFGFGTLSAEKKAGQMGKLYGINVVKLV